MSDDNFISRWSKRKLASKRGEELDPRLRGDDNAPQPVTPAPAGAQSAEPIPLPPIESLTHESDFTPFMQPDVDPLLKRQALRKLFDDPRFNVMDGLDVYIDDYTKTTPIPEGLLAKMEQMRHLGIFKGEETGEEKGEEEAIVKAVEEPSGGDEKLSQEQPVVQLPSVTSGEEIDAPPVGESGLPKG